MYHGPTVTDPMTGALTRAVFHDHVREALAVASANGEELSLLVLDLDHFKSINDAFGHARGDQVLVEFARRASDVSRGSDALFRFGGDEFVLLLPGTGSEQAVLLAERLIVAVRSAPFAGDPPLTISVSVGLATANGADDSAEELLARADRHLYAAKRAGRGRVAGNDEAKADNDGRLLEREGANQSVRQFLKLLSQYRRGALLASGIDGAGHTSFLREAQQNARLLGYRTVALTGRSAYATHPYFLDDRARSEVMFRESLEVKRRIGDAQGVAYAIGNLAGFSQNPDDELAAEEESLAIKRRLNDRQGIANSLANIGIRHARDGNYALADARLAESLALLLEIGREYKVADVLTSCAEQALERRDFAKALSLAASVTRWQQSA